MGPFGIRRINRKQRRAAAKARRRDTYRVRGPTSADGRLQTALSCHQAGRLAEAKRIYAEILSEEPSHAGALHLLGVVKFQQGDPRAATELIGKAIAVKPDFPEAHNNLGNVLRDQGSLEEAVAACRKALELKPDFAEAHNNLGNAFRDQGKLEAALAAYRKALELKPDFAEAHNNLGTALRDQGRLEEAAEHYKRALAIKPDYAKAHYNLGGALKDQGKLKEAVAAYRKALELKPDYAMALANLGNALHTQGKLDAAEESIRRAVDIEPDFAMARSNLGALLTDLGRHDEAEESLNRALKIDPDDAPAKYNLAHLLLLLGDFGRAWALYTARQSVEESRRGLWQKPLPDDLHGKRLLLLRDQGLGDEILFLRFAPELKARGASITYLAGAKIASIVERLPFIDVVVGEDAAPETADMNISVGDLPYLLGMKSVADVPPPLVLTPLPERVEAMAAKLAALGPAPYIGVTWRAGTTDKPGSLFKEISLEGLAGVLKRMSGTFLALQYKPAAGEIEALGQKIGRPVHDFTALNDALEDMLGLLALMDEYVTVSNTNVHLRAGTGRTSRVLVPNPPEYKWMAEGTESPWFPGCKVYRQKLDGEWAAAFDELSKDLANATGGP